METEGQITLSKIDVEQKLSTILNSPKSDKIKYDLPEIKKQWKKLADLWIKSSGAKEIHIGRLLVYYLRAEVMTHVKKSLPWQKLEFLLTILLLRLQKKLSNEEVVLCDLLLSRKFVENRIKDFTIHFDKFKLEEREKSKGKKTKYPKQRELVDKYNHLRRYRSLVQIRDLIQEFNQSSGKTENKNESFFLCLTKITELFLNTASSPNFPPSCEGFIDNMLMPVEISENIITRCRRVFGHMTSFNATSFEKLSTIFQSLEPIINVLIENEKREVVMKFLNRALGMEMETFKIAVEQFDEHNVPWFDADAVQIKVHTKLVDNLINKWEGLKKEYKYITPQIVEPGSLEYISEMLKCFSNIYEIMVNEFTDRVNPLLIKIANFKLAKDDASKNSIFENIKTSMKGYRNYYRYQK